MRWVQVVFGQRWICLFTTYSVRQSSQLLEGGYLDFLHRTETQMDREQNIADEKKKDRQVCARSSILVRCAAQADCGSGGFSVSGWIVMPCKL